jgi:exonuclease III
LKRTTTKRRSRDEAHYLEAPDFHIDPRNAYRQAMEWGFIDVFRKLHPERVQYTYWNYFRNA